MSATRIVNFFKKVLRPIFRPILKIRKTRYANLQKKKYEENSKKYQLELNNYCVSFKSINSKFFLPLYQSDLIQKEILINENYYEIKLLDEYCKKKWNGSVAQKVRGKCVLDIGSNIGNHGLYLLNECGAGKIYAYEPIKCTYDILKKNFEINGLQDKSVLLNVGVGEKSGSFAKILAFYEGNLGGTSIEMNDNGDIPVISIDEQNIEEEIAFIKIDTEGFEKNVIAGARDTIKRNRPFIMIEISTESNMNYIDSFLVELGYEYEQYDAQNYFYYPADYVN